MRIINWRSLNILEDGCGGSIFKIVDMENTDLKNVEISMCVFSPGEIAQLHYHEVMEEIYFFIEGEGEVELNGTWHKVIAEDAVPISLKTRH